MSIELFVWPSDFDLLSFDVECLQFLAACKFCALPVTIIHTAESSISPTKSLPNFKITNNGTNEVENITEFPKFVEYARKWAFDLVLDSELTTAQKFEVDAYYSYLKKTIYPAIVHLLWEDESNYTTLTHRWYFSKMSFFSKLYKIKDIREKELGYIEAKNSSSSDIIKIAMKTIKQLSMKLEDKKYFFGDKPSSLDALIFGYLAPLLKLPLPSDKLQVYLQGYPNLVRFVESILSIYLVIPEEQKRLSDKDKPMWEARKLIAQKEANVRRHFKDQKFNLKGIEDDSNIQIGLFVAGAVFLSILFGFHAGMIEFNPDKEDDY
uniref:Metaxin-1 homolog (inferred by orthology to a C. elegans protein) n=1 Tax=Strongyloides venezuelensis TaxID=75913 RepID=A0A0K0FB06_STRVS